MRPCVEAGIAASDLLASAGINPRQLDEPNARIHTEQVARLFSANQRALDDELMGMGSGNLPLGFFATAAELVLHCSTLAEACNRIERLYVLSGGRVRFDHRVNAGMAWVSATLASSAQDQDHFMSEYLLVTWHRFFCWLIAETIPLKQIDFAFPQPAHLAELNIMFPAPHQFNSARHGFSFDAVWLQRSPVRSPAELSAFLAFFPRDIMTIPGSENNLETRVQHFIRQKLDSEKSVPNSTEIANYLNDNPQKMYRQLRQQGRCIAQIKTDVRRELAVSLLRKKTNKIDDIAERCGFEDARSFTRAFGRWTGLSPRRFRQRS